MVEGALDPFAGLAALDGSWPGTGQLGAVDLDPGRVGQGILSPIAGAQPASLGDQRAVCLDALSNVHGYVWHGDSLCARDGQWMLCIDCGGADCGVCGPCSPRRTDVASGFRRRIQSLHAEDGQVFSETLTDTVPCFKQAGGIHFTKTVLFAFGVK